MRGTPASEDPWKTVRLRLSALDGIRSVQRGGETLSDVIMRLVADNKAAAVPWASPGSPHPAEAYRAGPPVTDPTRPGKDAGKDEGIVKTGTCLCCGAPAMECPYAKGTNGERFWKPLCHPCYDDPHNAISECEHGKGAGP